MKNIYVFLAGLFCATATGCGKEVLIDLNVPDANKYSRVYLPLANEQLIEKGLSIGDSIYQLDYSAYLGGSLDNKAAVQLKFEILPAMVDSFNIKNGTNYQLMPVGSYELQQSEAVIASGKKTTDPLHVSVKTKGFLEPFKSYLLPVTLTSASTQINQRLSTIYYLVTGAYAKGEVPRTKVYSFGTATGFSLFSVGTDLMQKTAAGTLQFFHPDADGTFGSPVQRGQGWDIFDVTFSFGGTRLIAREAAGGQNIRQYEIDQAGNISGGGTIGYGWGIFKRLFPYKGLLLGMHSSGVITQYPLAADGTFNSAQIRDIGSGWAGFAQLFAYENSLIAIEANGDMYQYPLSEQSVFGTRKKLGEGWDKYVSIIASGSDLLCLDAQGDLWRYKFSSLGYWPL